MIEHGEAARAVEQPEHAWVVAVVAQHPMRVETGPRDVFHRRLLVDVRLEEQTPRADPANPLERQLRVLEVVEDAVEEDEVERSEPLGLEVVDAQQEGGGARAPRRLDDVEAAHAGGRRVDSDHLPRPAPLGLEREEPLRAADVEDAQPGQVFRQPEVRKLVDDGVAPAGREDAGLELDLLKPVRLRVDLPPDPAGDRLREVAVLARYRRREPRARGGRAELGRHLLLAPLELRPLIRHADATLRGGATPTCVIASSRARWKLARSKRVVASSRKWLWTRSPSLRSV